MKRRLSTVVLSIGLMIGGTFFLMSCGGGGDEIPGATLAVSAGTLTKGSAIVNGVTFTAAAGATVIIDDNPSAEAGLRDGMQAKVKGSINPNGTTGTFTKVQAEPEARGLLAGKGLVDDFTVNGQHTVVDDLTKFENRDAAGVFSPITFNDLADGNEVEVHGVRDAAGNIHATRVERRVEDTLDEVKGRLAAAPVGTTFTLLASGVNPAITVNFAGATFSPAGKTATDLVAGVLVEVHGPAAAFAANTFTATRIDFEDAEDAEFEAAEGQHFEIEGLVSGFATTPGTFNVGTMSVRTTSATKFRGGIAADLANNLRVEVEGHKVSGILQVEKVKFKDNVRIEADVTASDATSLTVLGKTVKIMSTTETNNGPIVPGVSGVKIRGFASGSTITAIRIDVGNATNPNNVIIQGPISSFTATSAMTILGMTINTTAVEVNGFQAIEDVPVSAATFFSQLKTTAPVTIVKARGTFAGATLSARSVEIEDAN